MKKFIGVFSILAIVFSLSSFSIVDKTNPSFTLNTIGESSVEYSTFHSSQKTFPDKFVELRRDWIDVAPTVPKSPYILQKTDILSGF